MVVKYTLKPCAHALIAREMARVGFPHYGRTQKDHVVMLDDKFKIKQRHDILLIQVGMEAEIIGIDGFGCRQSRGLHGCLDPAFILCGDFLLKEMIQESHVGALTHFGLLQDVIEHTGRLIELKTV
jgi:hypothetical protein